MRKFLIILVIALSLSFVLFKEGDRTLLRQGFGVQADRTQENVPSISATLEVDDSRYEVSLSQGGNVYELMAAAKDQYGFSFGGREFPGIGFFVEEINGLQQSPRAGKYWIYYINGRKAEVGISVYQLKTHDVISWKYEDEK
jgi:hypothetical protein